MIEIHSEYVTLGQFLKLSDWVSSGGEAKQMIHTLKITVNGEKENRRGRKLYPNDVITIENKSYTLVYENQ